jgi:hypothetical protein
MLVIPAAWYLLHRRRRRKEASPLLLQKANVPDSAPQAVSPVELNTDKA